VDDADDRSPKEKVARPNKRLRDESIVISRNFEADEDHSAAGEASEPATKKARSESALERLNARVKSKSGIASQVYVTTARLPIRHLVSRGARTA